MSDEEKKAIIELNHFSNMTAYWKQEEYTNSEIDKYIKLVLNLIEKQQKEIEELKEGFKIQEHNYQVAMEEIEQRWKDKIKATIEEIDEEIKVKREIAKNPMDRVAGRLLTDSIVELEKTKKVLQSLLEEE